MFASRVQRDITVKVLDPENVAFLGADEIPVTIRKLSAASLERARIQNTIANAPPLRAMGGDLVKTLSSPGLDEAAKELAAKRATPEGRRAARYGAFDCESVLVAGVVRWGCEDKVKLSPQALSELDEPSARQIHEAILDLSLPPIDPTEGAAEGKGASAASTSS